MCPNGKGITGKRRTPHEQRSKMARILSQSGGNRMSSTENRRWPTDGLRSTANIWITSRRLIWTTRPRGDKDTDTIVLWTVKDRQCGAMSRRSDYKPTTNALIGLRQEQGRQNFYIPENERSRQKPFDEELQAKLEWLSQTWVTHFTAIFLLLIISTKLVAT